MRIGFVSLGCAKNRVDAETMMGLLEKAGNTIVTSAQEADAIIVNTCGFIESAKREAIDAIFEAANDKREDAKLIVTGCLAQRHPDELLSEMPEVDAVLGIGEIGDIASHVRRIVGGERYRQSDRGFTFCGDAPRVLTTPRHYAYLKIADGCDNRCAYCAIPGIRGGYVSRRPDDVLSEAKGLVRGGAKEIILIAQDTTRYGIDLGGEAGLSGLLGQLAAIQGDFWLRSLYCYPEMITERLLDAMRDAGACRYLDIPIQHANEDILRSMNRRGGRAAIERAYELARARGFALRTTVLVGFPGETQGQFDELMAFLRDHPFDRLGAFAYSLEEGTPAADMEGKVPKKIGHARERAVMLQQQSISRELLKARVGTTVRVLIEREEEGVSYGRSESEAPDIDGIIRVPESCEVGAFADVRITGSSEYDLEGVRA